MATTPSDQTLAQAAANGDQDAFAVLYDRYADQVHTFAISRLRDTADAADALQTAFITAFRKLDQLDDRARFRPWLFAIARTSVIDVARARGRHAAAATDDDLAEMATNERPPGRDLEAAESGALLWQAAAGLQPRDQELLELHLRAGLTGADLAEAMNVEAAHVSVMVKRLKERLGTAVGSLLVARRGADDCDDLQRVLEGWDGHFSLDIRAKITRHIESCDTCQQTRRAAIGWESIASAMPTFPAPAGSRAMIVAEVAQIARAARPFGGTSPRIMAAFTVFTAVLWTVVVIIFPVLDGEPDPTPQVALGEPAESPTTTTEPIDDADVAGEVETSTTAGPTSTTSSIPTSSVPTDSVPTTTTTTTAVAVPPAPATTIAPAAPTTTLASAPTTQPPTTTIQIGPAPTTIAPPTTSTTAAPTTTTTAPTTTAPPTTTLAPAGELALSDTTVDLGPTATTATITLTNRGDATLRWSAQAADSNLFAVSPASGDLAPNASVAVIITFDRTTAAEGDITSSLAVSSDGGDATVALRASVDVAPVIAIAAPAELWQNAGVCAEIDDPDQPIQGTATVTITDDARPISVIAAIRGAPATVVPSANDPDTFLVELGPSIRATVLTLSISATDARGNQAERSVTVTVNECEAAL